jgi:hypothetical protein
MVNREIREHPEGNPVIGDVFLFQKMTDLKTYRVKVDRFVTSAVTGDFTWTSGEAVAGDYDTNYIVEHEGNLYKSSIDDNPSIPGTNGDWVLLTRGRSGFTMWASGTFTEDQVFVLFQVLDAVYAFRLASVTRPYESLNFATEWAAGDWELLGRVQVVEVDTSGAFALDFRKLERIDFKQSIQITGNRVITLSNPVPGLQSFFRFSMDAPHQLTFPGTVKIANPYNAEWVTPNWTPLDGGEYEMEITYQVDQYNIKIHGPLT